MIYVKAQIEFVTIFAFIIIGIIVILVSSGIFVSEVENQIIIGLDEEKKLIKDSVLNTIKYLAKEELKEIYKSGGVSTNKENTIKYGAKEILIWYDCKKIEIPEIEKIIEKNMINKIKEVFKPQMNFFGKTVFFDLNNINISVFIQDAGVEIFVNMPTDVENSSISQPYQVFIPSRLKEILEVSKEIIKFNNNSKFFEAATLNTLLYSNPESKKWLPIIDLRTGCGNILFKTEYEIIEAVKNSLIYTTSHTVFNRNISIISENPFYVMWLSDSNINVSFIYPNDWDLKNNLDFKPNPAVFYPKPILPFSSSCIEIIYIKYSIRYPVIVLIKDDILDQLFNFVIMVNINENKPGCTSFTNKPVSYSKKCIEETMCGIGINVKDNDNLPIKNAIVTLGECYVGETNDFGSLTGVAPCMIGELSVYKEGYKEYKKLVKASDLKQYSIILEKKNNEKSVYFYGVPITPGEMKAEGVYKNYKISGQPKSIDLFQENYFVFIYFNSRNGENIILYNMDIEGFTKSSKIFLEDGVFDVFGIIVDSKGNVVGYIKTSYLSIGNENSIYIYLPIVEGLKVSIKPTEIYKLQDIFDKCNLKMITPEEQNVNIPCE